jgi:hypothetical protein
MHPYKPAPVHEIKGRIAADEAPAPVLVELEGPSDAGPDLGQVDSRRMCSHLTHPSGNSRRRA